MNKEKIIGYLKDAGIEYDEAASVEDLFALASAATREERWTAFLASARRVNPARFDAQKENKEFDVIPDSFK